MINNDTTARIKDTLNIVDVIDDYVSLKKKGVNYVGKCPFHADNSPSLIVSPAKQMFKCFACDAAGDVFKFIQDHEHVSFPEAIKILAKKANIQVEEAPMTEEQRKASLDREGMINANITVHSVYVSSLYSSPEGLQFLQSRNISPEIINEFGIGYAPDFNTINKMAEDGKISRNYTERLLLIKKNDKNQPYDAFRKRTIYPFYDLSGKIIGFTGRKIDWKKGDESAKFLNSSESALFKKDQILYGIFQAKKHIANFDKAFIVEGQHDVLSLHQNAVKNTVCGSGTAFSSAQARLLMRFTHNFTFIYDGDAAGTKATINAIQVALAEGANVRVISLPEGEDPDTFAQKYTDDLLIRLSNIEIDFVEFILKLRENDLKDTFKQEDVINELCTLLALIERDLTRKGFIRKICDKLNIEDKIITDKIKTASKPKEKIWKNGIYGIEEAKEIIKKDDTEKVYLTFSEKRFIENTDDQAIVYARGKITKSNVQILRTAFSEINVSALFEDIHVDDVEETELLVLKDIYRSGMKINVEKDENFVGFLDFYTSGYSGIIENDRVTDNVRAEYIDRCAEMISFADTTLRTVMMKSYAALFKMTVADLKSIVQPYLEKKKDRAILEMRRIDTEDDLFNFDSEFIPDYVEEDPAMKNTYMRDGFYPLINKSKNRVAYMFKNEKGGGHTCITDFYMEPLLHVYNRDSEANKRVIKLNHIHGPTQYVEWKSSILATLSKVNEKLIDEGDFNFEGTSMQFKRIWKTMSYQFKKCTEMRVFGQQPEEFWAFSNAIIYDELDKTSNEIITKVEHADHMGIMAYKDKYYYSPAFSEIYNNEREEDDKYKMERYFVYKEPIESMRITFEEWAQKMNNVYAINDNGKWAVVVALMSCFRDYIFSQHRFFTTLFFIGPTGSGKSEVAESMRSLYMVPEAPKFNLNFGSDASFFIVLEGYKNVIQVMEEYNDGTISQTKFQGLKAAVFDGEGKTKVKDIASKSLDRSKINSIPIILGQEAPQQDDGSLSNRCILCEVPYKAKGEWTDEETYNWNELKKYERSGLCNVLLEILSQRKQVKKYFNSLFTDEVKLIKNKVSGKVTNTEGLARIINSMALTTTMCKLVELNTPLNLPFTYDEFFQIATDKVLKQVEMISTSNKLSNYFTTIGYLINQGKIKIGKELKVSVPKDGKVTVKTNGNTTEEKKLPSMETKVLYIDFGAIYPLYQQTVKDALTKASLQSYFNSNSAYLGLCKSTQFKWFEEVIVPVKQRGHDGEATGVSVPGRELEAKHNNTSAFMFNYDILKELMDIDFERIETILDEDKPF